MVHRLGSYSDEQPAIPAAAGNVDTYHANDTALGTAATFWLDQLGAQLKGLADAAAKGSGLMWLGIGIVVVVLMSKKR